MGQKANPISLRLKTTNKSFDSCWYSYLHYSTLLSLDIKARSYLDKIFEQIRYPKPLVALTLMPKRGKVLMLYLNPERSRGERGERFQLRPLIPSRPLQRRAHPLPNGGLGVGVEPGQRQAPLVGTRLWGSSPHGLAQLGRGAGAANDHRSPLAPPSLRGGSPASRGSGNCRGWMPRWERKLFIYSTLLSITKRRGNTASLLLDKDFALFYRMHRLVWFEGRGEGYLSLINQLQPYAHGLTRAGLNPGKKPTGKGASSSRPPYGTSGRAGSSSWGGYSNPARSSRGLHTLSPLALAPSVAGRRPPAPGPCEQKRGLRERPHTGPMLAPVSWLRSSIREIRKQGNHSSISTMEAVLGRGLGLSVAMYPYKSMEEEQTARFLSEEIAYYLERRVPFRRIKQALMRELQKRYIEGVKVSCSGRVGGRSKKAQRSREEGFQWGQTSSHVFSSKLGFASRSALTPFGKVGIKVWICYK